MSPNEWGDFLAGLAGPLVLGWAILSVTIQAKELRASVEMLGEQVSTAHETLSFERNSRQMEMFDRLHSMMTNFMQQADMAHSKNRDLLDQTGKIQGALSSIVEHNPENLHRVDKNWNSDLEDVIDAVLPTNERISKLLRECNSDINSWDDLDIAITRMRHSSAELQGVLFDIQRNEMKLRSIRDSLKII